jgi:hypothetical protein
LNAPLILALDISKSCTGVAQGRAGEKPRLYSIRGKDDDVTRAVSRLGRWLIELTNVDRPDFIYSEASISAAAFMGKWDAEAGRIQMTSNPQTTVALAKMTGVVEFIADMRSIAYRSAHVQTVRKAFIGSGHLKGPEAKRRAFELCNVLGWTPSNRDESDAAAVHFYAQTIVAPSLAPLITPMMQAELANRIGGVEIEDADALFRAPKVKAARARKWR